MSVFQGRLSGILLHPTSLPGPNGAGDFGPSAYHFVDWLHAAGQTVWQVLPLNPVGPGNSPYASASSFAGSPLMVALEPLVQKGWLAPVTALEQASFHSHHVDFATVTPFRVRKLQAAAEGFFARGSIEDQQSFVRYCKDEAYWLDDYALFMALDADDQRHGGGEGWPSWAPELAARKPAALAAARNKHADAIRFWQFVQWCFSTQWAALKAYANGKGIRIVGDLPIFVAHHSADCWARPDLYLLDAAYQPRVVAGVPPDFFSATGQRWGNPLYDWAAMSKEGFAWWIARVKRQLELADIVRIDHFRGFAAYWEIPASCPTAIDGKWVPAPGEAVFKAIRNALGDLPIIAEDLGVITPDVEALRDQFDFPGMRILQFGFGGDAHHAFLPHNYVRNCVVYTGTHDNDTLLGWWSSCSDRERAYARNYLASGDHDIHWALIRAASASVARLACFQMQDVLGLDGKHRMNTPSAMDCWTWRFSWDQVGPEPAKRLAAISAAYGRAPLDVLHLPLYPNGKPLP